MWIEQIQLRQFRNYPDLSLHFVPHKNLFIGSNGAGKSNLLEAIFFLSHARSYRTRQDRELIAWENAFASVQLTVHSNHHGGESSLEVQWVLSEAHLKTVFKRNGHPLKRRSDILGALPSVPFFVSDLLMLRGAPEDRRSALDRALSQLDPLHFKRLTDYQKIRQHKAGLLKQSFQPIDPELLATLNQQLVSTGAAVMLARMAYLKQLETGAQSHYAVLSQRKEQLQLRYQPSFSASIDNCTLDFLEVRLTEAIEQVAFEEQRRGQVLVGPHRDDVRFYLNGRDASLYGSQGQQRTIVLAWKLSEISLLEQQLHQETPILLLDDVMAELDPERQMQLLASLNPQMQVFLTTTHLDSGLQWFLESAASASIFSVSNGTIQNHQDTQAYATHPKTAFQETL